MRQRSVYFKRKCENLFVSKSCFNTLLNLKSNHILIKITISNTTIMFTVTTLERKITGEEKQQTERHAYIKMQILSK